MNDVQMYRAASFRSQDGLCCYCDQPMWLLPTELESFATRWGLTAREAARHRATAEHLRAKRDGGDDDAGNIVAACQYCNQHRHKRGGVPARLPQAHREHVQRRRDRRTWHRFWPLRRRTIRGTLPGAALVVRLCISKSQHRV